MSRIVPLRSEVVLFLACLFVALGVSLARADIVIRRSGSSWAIVEDDGTLRINGSSVGKVESDGTVRKAGSSIGNVESNGTIRRSGSMIGTIEPNGALRKSGSSIGVIESGGTIRKNGSSWGTASSCCGDHGSKLTVTAVAGFFDRASSLHPRLLGLTLIAASTKPA